MSRSTHAAFLPCSAETWRDPFPMYAALREQDPVHHVAGDRDGNDYWVLSRFRDVLCAAVDAATFSSAEGLTFGYGEMEKLGIEAPIVMMDPPEHTALRKLAIKQFTPRRVESLAPMIRDFVVERIERLRERGEGDVVAELLKPLPSVVVAHFLGVPLAARPGTSCAASSRCHFMPTADAEAQRGLGRFLNQNSGCGHALARAASYPFLRSPAPPLAHGRKVTAWKS